MRAFAEEEWKRALLTLNSGTKLIESDPDSAASRAYYSAFHALTALFALRNQTFTKHSAKPAIMAELCMCPLTMQKKLLKKLKVLSLL